MVAQMIAAFPALCPNLQKITFNNIPRDPTITAAVSEMLIASNRNALRSVCVDSPLTEEGYEAVFKLPNLRELSVIIEGDTSLPSMVLSNLAKLIIEYGGDWLPMFHGAAFGKLESVVFDHRSGQIGDFLEAFKRVALAASVQNTLTRFNFYTSHSWNSNYSSLLPFTHLKEILIYFSCDDGCSSRVDDEIITNLARTMPNLESLELGSPPCQEIPIGVTVKGLVALADHCPDLSELCIHFQVDSLCEPPAVVRTSPDVGSIAPRRVCLLPSLAAGRILLPRRSVPMVALTLARIFPYLESIDSGIDEKWGEVADAIKLSREIVDCSSKENPLSTLRSDFDDISPGATLKDGG